MPDIDSWDECNIELVDSINENDFLSDNYFSETKFRKISSRFVKDIILARLDEILDKVFKEINFLQTKVIKQNLFFTGGASRLNNLEEIVNFKLSNSNINIETDKF